jgi:hypothetical protein
MLIERAAKWPIEDGWKVRVVGGNVEDRIEACKLRPYTRPFLNPAVARTLRQRQVPSNCKPIPFTPSLRHKASLARLSSAVIRDRNTA